MQILVIFRYLQEIGYTDKVLDMRSARIRSLLGVTTDDLPADTTEHHFHSRESRKKHDRHVVADGEQNNEKNVSMRYINR